MPKTFYITTAIDYANGKPHLGHLYEKIIADALARWHEQLGEDVFFLTGTDEHGQKIARTAEANGKNPQKFVDEVVVHFKKLCEKLNISNNDFIRTTEKRHIKVCEQVWQKVLDKGLIHKGKYEGLYCTGCEAYVTEKDLVSGKCPAHQNTPEKLSEESYFFKLSQFQDKLLKHYEEHPGFILPSFRRKEIINRVKEGLKNLSSSRTTLKWGIPVPNDPKHVVYVWFDALLNYISALGYPDGERFKKYWPANAHVIGKDINWFHSVIWPAILTALGVPLPKTIVVHGFVNVKGEKLSKSLGRTVDPFALINLYGTDKVRYYFLREIPAGLDGDFTEESFVDRTNADLADALGNLLQRTSVLIHKKFGGEIPKPAEFTKKEKEIIDKANNLLKETDSFMQKFEWHKALEKIWEFVHECNKYVNDAEPWKEKDEKRLATILYTLAESLRIISVFAWPFIPESAEKISKQLGQKLGKFENAKFSTKTTGKLEEPQILFTKQELKTEELDPFRKLMLRVGVVEDVQPHPNADKLYVLHVNLGEEKRTLVAGLKQHYKPEQLKNKHLIVLTNLKPAKLRGVESQGMLLAAEKNNTVKILEAPNSQPGSDVYVEGLPCEHQKISLEDFQKIKLTTKNNKVWYNGKPLKTEKEEIIVEISDGATIR